MTKLPLGWSTDAIKIDIGESLNYDVVLKSSIKAHDALHKDTLLLTSITACMISSCDRL